MKNLTDWEKKPRYGYMDLVDYQHEVGEALGGNKIYPDIEDLKENNSCWQECGIVKVEIRAIELIVSQNLHEE